MESELITKIITGGGGLGAALYLINWRINKFEKTIAEVAEKAEKFHKEGMSSMEKVVEKVGDLITQTAIHNEKFTHGEERMDRLEARSEIISDRVHKLTDRVQITSLKIEAIEKREKECLTQK